MARSIMEEGAAERKFQSKGGRFSSAGGEEQHSTRGKGGGEDG